MDELDKSVYFSGYSYHNIYLEMIHYIISSLIVLDHESRNAQLPVQNEQKTVP